MPLKLSIYYINSYNKQDINSDNLIIPIPEQCFLIHEKNFICLYDTKNHTSIEKQIHYKKITFNPVHNTLFCVKEQKENDQIHRTLDELRLNDLSTIKTNIPIPFLTPTWLDDDRWLGFDGSFLMVYNHKTQQEETQLAINVKSLTVDQDVISVDSGYQTTLIRWENQELTEISESRKESFLTYKAETKKIISMPDDENFAILTAEEDNACKIDLLNATSHDIASTLSFTHDIEDITALSDNRIIATVDATFANKEVANNVSREILTSLPSTLRDPCSIINEYVGNQVLYPFSLFRPAQSITNENLDVKPSSQPKLV